jgi:hypothetical protein
MAFPSSQKGLACLHYLAEALKPDLPPDAFIGPQLEEILLQSHSLIKRMTARP